MNKTIIAGLVALGTLIGGWHLVHGDGGTLVNGGLMEGSVPADLDPQLGALSSPDIFSPFLKVNGLEMEYRKIPMAPATTTVCRILGPSSTSTLVHFAAHITTGTSTAATFDVSTSTAGWATSTMTFMKAVALASGAQGTFVWGGDATTTNASFVGVDALNMNRSDNVIGPNQYVVMKTAGAGLGGYTWTGNCQAEFRVMR